MRANHEVTVAALALLATLGCAEDETIAITGVQPVTRMTMCMPMAAAGGMLVLANDGLLDVGIVEGGYGGFVMYPMVRNNLVSMNATDDISLLGFDIEIVLPPANQTALPLSQRSFFQPSFGGVVRPGGEVAVELTGVPRQIAVQVGSSITGAEVDPVQMALRMRAVGNHAGSTVMSKFITFPVGLCRYCLTRPVSCPEKPAKKDQVLLGSCNPAQDAAVTCCVRDKVLLCGDQVPVEGS